MKIVLPALFCFVFTMSIAQTSKPTVADAEKFMQKAEARLAELSVKANQANWVHENFITDDTEALAADVNDEQTAVTTELIEQAKRFEGLKMPAELARKFLLLKLTLVAPGPHDPALRKAMSQVAASLDSDYGKGKYCDKSGKCLDITAIEKEMGENRDPERLKELWVGWHAVGAPMRGKYGRFVELSNQGARDLGFKDTGALWRAGYDMPPEKFAADVDRLWEQVRPLYLSLYTFVRTRLSKNYGPQVVSPDGPMRADLLGNPWAQEWGNIFPLMGLPETSRGYDVTDLLRARNLDAHGMVKYGENFYKSLGFDPLPQTFWERSLFVKPADRDVVCHASAWDIDNKDDLRIKMCIQVNDTDFVTIHHELGHNFYQRAYKSQPYLFINGANDGFHEAIGDTIALAITPEYLKEIGLLEKLPPEEADIPILLKQALNSVAFLPFGVMIDKWRWGVFSGEIKPADYNKVMVGPAAEISGRGAAGWAQRIGFRSRGEVSRSGEHALHALLPCADLSVPVLSRAMPRVGVPGAAEPLHVFRIERSRSEAEQDAGNGAEQTVARRDGGPNRSARRGCQRDPRIFRAVEEVAG